MHHHQLLQTLFDIFSRDRAGCQAHLDFVLEGSRDKLKMKAVRERVQRWLANQRNVSWLVHALELKTVNIIYVIG